MEVASLHGAIHPRSGADDQSQTSGMVQLLRAFHAFCVPAHRTACRPIVGPLGLSQIQEAAPSPHSGLGVAAPRYPSTADLACVVGTTARGFHHRSRMSGDSHVRFWEGLRVQFHWGYLTTERGLKAATTFLLVLLLFIAALPASTAEVRPRIRAVSAFIEVNPSN